MARVVIVARDATESLDAWYPYHRLREEGIEVAIGAPTKKVLNSMAHDFEPGWDTSIEKPGYRIPAEVAFRDVNPEEYDALIVSGGRAQEHPRNDLRLLKIVTHFVEQKKPIAALCHGSLILAAPDAIRDSTIATYEALAPDMERSGAIFANTEVVVDGNLVSSRTWMDRPFFMREFLKVLRAAEKKAAAGARA